MYRRNLAFGTAMAAIWAAFVPLPDKAAPPLADMPGKFGKKARDFPNPRKRARRAAFIEAYQGNPMNVISGTENHKIHRLYPPHRWETEAQKILDERARRRLA